MLPYQITNAIESIFFFHNLILNITLFHKAFKREIFQYLKSFHKPCLLRIKKYSILFMKPRREYFKYVPLSRYVSKLKSFETGFKIFNPTLLTVSKAFQQMVSYPLRHRTLKMISLQTLNRFLLTAVSCQLSGDNLLVRLLTQGNSVAIRTKTGNSRFSIKHFIEKG